MSDALSPGQEPVLAAWAARVRAEREQVERAREAPDGADFYAPIAQAFKADPRRTDEPTLDTLRGLVRTDDVVLDIGAGGGRYALPLALVAKEVIAVEPSAGMRGVLEEGMREHGIANVRCVESRWPMETQAPAGDIAMMAHVGYDIEEIGPFVDAMEASARRICVAVLLDKPPRWAADVLWERVHGERRVRLPALPEFLSLLIARGTLFELSLSPRPPMSYASVDDAMGLLRRQLWTEAGSEKDQRLEQAARELLTERDGRVALSWTAGVVGVVSWKPRGLAG